MSKKDREDALRKRVAELEEWQVDSRTFNSGLRELNSLLRDKIDALERMANEANDQREILQEKNAEFEQVMKFLKESYPEIYQLLASRADEDGEETADPVASTVRTIAPRPGATVSNRAPVSPPAVPQNTATVGPSGSSPHSTSPGRPSSGAGPSTLRSFALTPQQRKTLLEVGHEDVRRLLEQETGHLQVGEPRRYASAPGSILSNRGGGHFGQRTGQQGADTPAKRRRQQQQQQQQQQQRGGSAGAAYGGGRPTSLGAIRGRPPTSMPREFQPSSF